MRLTLVVLLTTLVASCGQKGPLELPQALGAEFELGASTYVGP